MNPMPGRAPGQILILVNERRPFWVFARSFWRGLSMRNILINADASPAMAARTETDRRVGRQFGSQDRKGAGQGKRGSVWVDRGGGWLFRKNKHEQSNET